MIILIFWELVIYVYKIPFYIFPRPILIFETLINEWHSLFAALMVTIKVTIIALFISLFTGILFAIIISQFRWIELSIFPIAIVLQVTPIIAIAPLIIILVDNTFIASLICAWLVSFFPILSSTLVGLKSTKRSLLDLFYLYKSSSFQNLIFLKLPYALPYILSGFKISSGLSLIGAIVSEFVTGIGGSSSGLAYVIIESSYRLEVPKMFAALVLIAFTGIVLYFFSKFLSWFLLYKWHESEQDLKI